mgnify:CR=1 FL=1
MMPRRHVGGAKKYRRSGAVERNSGENYTQWGETGVESGIRLLTEWDADPLMVARGGVVWGKVGKSLGRFKLKAEA